LFNTFSACSAARRLGLLLLLPVLLLLIAVLCACVCVCFCFLFFLSSNSTLQNSKLQFFSPVLIEIQNSNFQTPTKQKKKGYWSTRALLIMARTKQTARRSSVIRCTTCACQVSSVSFRYCFESGRMVETQRCETCINEIRVEREDQEEQPNTKRLKAA
jgi:hypothetical protein